MWPPLKSCANTSRGKPFVVLSQVGIMISTACLRWKNVALIYDGVKHYFIVNFPQRPGALREFVNDILGPNDDITRFEYIKRASKGTGPVLIGVTLANKHDYAGLVNRIERFDPSFINLNGNETLYNMLV